MGTSSPLTLCMIVKNEQAHLARCLESVRDLVDEMIIVDTGSSDSTLDIARSFNARILQLPWPDDFSAARNFSLSHATGEWILALDADESIARRDHPNIRAAMARDDIDAVIVPQRHYLMSTVVGWRPGSGGYDEGHGYAGYRDVDCRRFFRNRPWLRFRNRVHEELVSTDPARPLIEARGNWVVHHFGKLDDAARLRAKGEAYLRIGLKKIEDDPQNPNTHYELGIQYSELNRPEDALACFERALALVPEFRDSQIQIAICYSTLERHQDALAALRNAADVDAGYVADIALLEGNAHRALGDRSDAERAFHRALAARPGFAPACLNLALLLSDDGRHSEALANLDQALARSPKHPDLLLLRARLRRLADDFSGALSDLEQLGRHDVALGQRARILARLGRFVEADACLAAISDQSDAEVTALRGAVALGVGRVDDAITALRASLRTCPTHEAARNLASALHAVGDDTGAREAAAEALRLAPEDAASLSNFAALTGQTLRSRARDKEALTFIFCQPKSVPYDARTPRERGLGGTESAVVYLAEALARRGHRVAVLNHCDEPGMYNGVEYGRWESLPARCLADRPDVVVGVRFWQMIGQLRLAPLQIFWTADAFDQPFLYGLANSQRRVEVDFVMLHSGWQSQTFAATHGIAAWQIVRTNLGIAASATSTACRPQLNVRPRRLAYASTPFRGLDILLDLFPRIRAACPDAELEIFTSMQVYGLSAAEDARLYESLYAKAQQPGATLVGTLPQLQLAERLQQCRVLAYPNHFAETFCIAAAEAMAAGCVPVTSALGALPETAGDGGVCVPGPPQTAEYQQSFVDTCVRLLSNDAEWLALASRGVDRAWGEFAYDGIAVQWERFCRTAITPEPAAIERISVHLAARRFDLVERIIHRHRADDEPRAAAWAALLSLTAWLRGNGEKPSDDERRQIAWHFPSIRRLWSAATHASHQSTCAISA